MKLENAKVIVKRPYKEVYKTEEGIMKVFEKTHPKSAVFNEALNTVRVEETGLEIPKLKEVTQIDEKWALVIEYKDGKTLEEMMKVDHDNLEKYMSDFVDLQLKVHEKKAPMLFAARVTLSLSSLCFSKKAGNSFFASHGVWA